jgi:hypothetical protein
MAGESKPQSGSGDSKAGQGGGSRSGAESEAASPPQGGQSDTKPPKRR